MVTPTDPNIRKKVLTPLLVSGIGFLALSFLGIAGFAISLKVADSTIDHSEMLFRASLDYDELTRLSRISFGPDAIACKWELWTKDNREHLIWSIFAPSPTDFEETISGYVIVSEEGTKSILAEYDWKPVMPGDPADAPGTDVGSIKKELLELIDTMGLKDRTLLYSESFGNKVTQESPYAGMILFDAEDNRFFFLLHRSSSGR